MTSGVSESLTWDPTVAWASAVPTPDGTLRVLLLRWATTSPIRIHQNELTCQAIDLTSHREAIATLHFANSLLRPDTIEPVLRQAEPKDVVQ